MLCPHCSKPLHTSFEEKDKLIDAVVLSDQQFEVLKLLVRKDRITKESIMISIWGFDEEPKSALNQISVILNNVRKKIRPFGFDVKTVVKSNRAACTTYSLVRI